MPIYTPYNPSAPDTMNTTKPGRDDFIRAAGILCLADRDRIQSMFPSTDRTTLFVACMRAYLAREGITLP